MRAQPPRPAADGGEQAELRKEGAPTDQVLTVGRYAGSRQGLCAMRSKPGITGKGDQMAVALPGRTLS
jgi:hypothetical protein